MMNTTNEQVYESPALKVLDFQCNAELHAPPHEEQSVNYSICFPRKGAFVFRYGRVEHEFNTETILHENPGATYSVHHVNRENDACTVIYLNSRILSDIRDCFWRKGVFQKRENYGLAEQIFPAAQSRSTPRLAYLHFQLFKSAFSKNSLETRLSPDSLGVELALEIFRSLYGVTPLIHPSQIRPATYDLERIENAKNYILSHFSDEISLSDIARVAFLSEFHFLRLFKKVTGRTPYHYLLEVRLNHALQLKRSLSLSTAEVCFRSGFKDVSRFIDAFRRYFGFTPSKAVRTGVH